MTHQDGLDPRFEALLHGVDGDPDEASASGWEPEELDTGDVVGQLAQWGHQVFTEITTNPHWPHEKNLIAQVRGLQVAIGALTAAQTVRIAQFAAHGHAETLEGTYERLAHDLGHIDEFASDTLAPMLGMSHRPAATRVRTSVKLATDLPRTLAAVAAGDLDPFRAHIIAEELSLADHDICAAVEALIFPAICGDSPGAARNRVRRALHGIDPDLVRQRAARAKLERFVSTRASHLPGMTEWLAQLPATDSAKAWAAIDQLARTQQLDDPSRTLDQHRADALLDLILGNTTINAHLTIAIPITRSGPGAGTDTDTDTIPAAFGGPPPTGSSTETAGVTGGDHTDNTADETAQRVSLADYLWTRLAPEDPTIGWVEIPHIGLIPAGMALAMAGDFGTKITRMLIDPETGTTLETKATGYRPPAGIARFVRLRDGTCRFPNCARRAENCDIDHLTPWPAGPTAVTNLICLCAHHHRLKHRTAWRPELHRDGTITWTDPYGDRWITHPTDHRQSAAA